MRKGLLVGLLLATIGWITNIFRIFMDNAWIIGACLLGILLIYSVLGNVAKDRRAVEEWN